MGVGGFLQLVVIQATMLWRNTGFWLSSIMMAVLSMAVFGWLFNPDTQPFDLALVDEDRSEASQTLAEAFDGIENVTLRRGDREGQMAALEDGDRAAGSSSRAASRAIWAAAPPRCRPTTITPTSSASAT